MNSLEKAEKIILEKIHATTPHLKYVLADMIDGKSYKYIADKYTLNIASCRNLKSRYKDYINKVSNDKNTK